MTALCAPGQSVMLPTAVNIVATIGIVQGISVTHTRLLVEDRHHSYRPIRTKE